MLQLNPAGPTKSLCGAGLHRRAILCLIDAFTLSVIPYMIPQRTLIKKITMKVLFKHFAMISTTISLTHAPLSAEPVPIKELVDAPQGEYDYDGTINGKEILTPKPGPGPKLTGATVFGVRPGRPIRTCVTATGVRPMSFSATGLPPGVSIDSETGWITGRAPRETGDVTVTVIPTPNGFRPMANSRI